MKTETIEIKWTVSRGYSTEGWNICSLWKNSTKETSCKGGGYDMKGTVLADYLVATYGDRLMKLHSRAAYRYSVNGTGCKRLKDRDLYGLYAYYRKGEHKPYKVGMDGGCGWDSIATIARLIGLEISHLAQNRNSSFYQIRDKREN